MDNNEHSSNKSTASNAAPNAKSLEGGELEPFFSNTHLNDSKRHTVKTSRIYLVTISANLLSIALGTCLSWSSPMGVKLTSQDTSDSPLNTPVTMNEMALISSIFTFGSLITPFIAGSLAEKIGRKRLLLFTSIFFILGYILLIIGKVLWVLLVARTIVGLGIGLTLCTTPMYVGEISTDRTRGATISFMPLSISVGIFFGYCVGPYVSYMMLQYLCLIVPIIFDVGFIFMPESPYYYVAKGKREAASKSLQFLRGQDSQTVEDELKSIENFVSRSMNEKSSILEVVKTPGSRKALVITIGLFFIQQISGMNAVMLYTEEIFESAHIDLDAAVAAIIVGFVQLVVSGFAPMVVQKFRRKIILLYASAFMGISQAAFGYYFFAKLVLNNTSGITWLPVTAMVFYHIAFGLGYGPVPWAVLSEIFAPNTKAFAGAIATFIGFTTGFSVALFYPTLDALGTYYAFWLFSIFCFLGFFFVLFFVIETKGLSFAEIQTKFQYGF